MTQKNSIRDFDWPLLALAFLISGLGVLEIYSAAGATAWEDAYLGQIAWVAVGFVLLWISSGVNYHWLVGQSPALYGLTIAGLLAVWAFGPTINGSQRWLPFIGGVNLQVSEFAKVVLVLLAARLFSELPKGGLKIVGLLKGAAIFSVPWLLVLRQPDLSTSLSYVPIFGIGVLLGGLRWKYVSIGVLAALLMLPLVWRSLEPYQQARLTTFMDPEQDPRGRGYQSLQSKIAVGAGGIWGQGFARGSQTQLRFLPVPHTDFVFAAYAEETGFVGVTIALTLYFALLMRIVHNAQTASDSQGMLVCMGVAALLLFHVVVNVGMVVNKMPVTGIPLPLMSYGGSSTLTTFLLLGLVNNVHMRRFAN